MILLLYRKKGGGGRGKLGGVSSPADNKLNLARPFFHILFALILLVLKKDAQAMNY